MRGVFTALVTPFQQNLEIDWEAFDRLLQDQRDAGVAGVIPCGTTGESPVLTQDEKKKLIQRTLDFFKGTKTRVVAGTGSNSTAKTVELSSWASRQGVAGVLIVTPYYNKPSQTGLSRHFRAVADAVECEVMLYNVPGRTGVSLAPETVAELSEHPRIRSLKEATGNVALTSEIRNQLSLAGRSIDILSGDDATYLPLLSAGAVGVVSVASNLFPRAMIEIQAHYEAGRVGEALALHEKHYALFRDLFVESNPVPIKAALRHVGLCQPHVRAPLAPLQPASLARLQRALSECGITPGRAAR